MTGGYADAESAAFRRLHALVRERYRAGLGDVEVIDAICLRHRVDNDARAPRLVLYSDDTMTSVSGKLRILAQDGEAFAGFLRRIPYATAWQRFLLHHAIAFGCSSDET